MAAYKGSAGGIPFPRLSPRSIYLQSGALICYQSLRSLKFIAVFCLIIFADYGRPCYKDLPDRGEACQAAAVKFQAVSSGKYSGKGNPAYG